MVLFGVCELLTGPKQNKTTSPLTSTGFEARDGRNQFVGIRVVVHNYRFLEEALGWLMCSDLDVRRKAPAPHPQKSRHGQRKKW
jgi:hypothetical protein